MSLFFDQTFSVARIEWQVLWRGLGLRLLLAIVAVPFVVYLVSAAPLPADSGISMLLFAAPLAGLLPAFLIVPSTRRELRYHVDDLTWLRPLDGLSYVAGKLLAALLIVAALLTELAALVLVRLLAAGVSIDVSALMATLLATAISLTFATTLYLVCGVVLPRPLLGYVVAVALVFLFALYLNENLLVLWNPWAHGVSYNRALEFGPDAPLLLANRLFYSGLTVALIGLALLLFARGERRALAPRRQYLAALLVLGVGVLLAALSIPRFQSAVAATTLSGPVVQPQMVALAVQRYALDLAVDPATGAQRGVAQFTVRNDGQAPLTELSLYLNDGLRIDEATVDGRAIPVRSSALFGRIILAPALGQGRFATIRLTYDGHFKLLHAQYGTTARGLQAPADVTAGNGTALYAPPLHQSLIGMGTAVLLRDGDWYPLPWTQGTLNRQPPPLGWYSLRVRLPASATVIASTAQQQHVGDQQVFTWSLRGRLPMAVLAAVSPHYRRVEVPGGTIYAPQDDTATLRAQYGPYVAAFHDLTAFFSQPTQHVTVVALPLSNASSRNDIATAVGGTLALVPLTGIDRAPDGIGLHTSRLAAPAPYRAALSDLAAAWWANRVLSPSDGPTRYAGRDDLADGYIGVTEPDAYYMLSIAGYTGAAVAGQRFGVSYYLREMALRRTLSTLGKRDLMGLYQVVVQEQGPLAQELIALGLQRRLGDDGTTDTAPALDDLRRAIGAERLHDLLRGLSAAGRLHSSEASVACALGHATGKPVARWMNRYLPSVFLLRSPGGCR